ncbi:hypothetical protein [Paraburkholderia ribeironis]|uniref:hypothetical protein n=1 Tax=Paraburkholderia ribeironis TaxID=1247936 RepID=UPI001178A5B6|nr:hypothetical protein [Paraburkholderia ribeironis]
MMHWCCIGAACGNDDALHRFDGTLKLRDSAARIGARITEWFRDSLDGRRTVRNLCGRERAAAKGAASRLSALSTRLCEARPISLTRATGARPSGTFRFADLRAGEWIGMAGYDVFLKRPVLNMFNWCVAAVRTAVMWLSRRICMQGRSIEGNAQWRWFCFFFRVFPC